MKKFEKTMLVVSDYAGVRPDKKLNIDGTFETIYATNLPAMHKSLYLVGIFSVDDNSLEKIFLNIDLLNAKGESIVENKMPPLEIVLSKTNRKVRFFNIVVNVNDILFKEYGEYKFTARVGEDVIGESLFFVEKPLN
ncbi:MAG: hypothetical protein HY425_03130 [Candidatus Levybacteria bacterium]|nr:hypothetical protein [Candidatus Levybacteria bacterium]